MNNYYKLTTISDIECFQTYKNGPYTNTVKSDKATLIYTALYLGEYKDLYGSILDKLDYIEKICDKFCSIHCESDWEDLQWEETLEEFIENEYELLNL